MFQNIFDGKEKAQILARSLHIMGIETIPHLPTSRNFVVNLAGPWKLSVLLLNGPETALMYQDSIVFIASWNYLDVIEHPSNIPPGTAIINEVIRMKKILNSFQNCIPTFDQAKLLDQQNFYCDI